MDQCGNQKSFAADDGRNSVLLKFDPLLKKPVAIANESNSAAIDSSNQFNKTFPSQKCTPKSTLVDRSYCGDLNSIKEDIKLEEEISFEAVKTEQLSPRPIDKSNNAEMNSETIKDNLENKEVEDTNIENNELQMR